MLKRLLCLLTLAGSNTLWAVPPPPATGDLYGWELPRVVAIDTIEFPRRLKRNRSYGRVVAEIALHRDGARQDIEYTLIENGDLTRWAEKIISSMEFTPARLDGSQRASRVPVHVVFLPSDGERDERIEVWLPTDSAVYQPCLQAHFLEINESLAPLLIRAGSYDLAGLEPPSEATVTFEVFVRKDGSREEGRLIQSPGDEFTRRALAAALELQILPPRYQGRSYGCWTRVIAGFCADWSYPTRSVDRSTEFYRGWPAPVVAPVGVRSTIPPHFAGVDADSAVWDMALLRRAAELVHGHAIYCARIDTSGRVAEWFRARAAHPAELAIDYEYLSYGSKLLESLPDTELSGMSLPELARLAADELERILPSLVFAAGRDESGRKIQAWVAVTAGILR